MLTFKNPRCEDSFPTVACRARNEPVVGVNNVEGACAVGGVGLNSLGCVGGGFLRETDHCAFVEVVFVSCVVVVVGLLQDVDTIDVKIDLGFGIYKTERVRIAGIDTPEKRTKDLEEKALGLDATNYMKDRLEGVLHGDEELTIRTELKGDDFDRVSMDDNDGDDSECDDGEDGDDE